MQFFGLFTGPLLATQLETNYAAYSSVACNASKQTSNVRVQFSQTLCKLHSKPLYYKLKTSFFRQRGFSCELPKELVLLKFFSCQQVSDHDSRDLLAPYCRTNPSPCCSNSPDLCLENLCSQWMNGMVANSDSLISLSREWCGDFAFRLCRLFLRKVSRSLPVCFGTSGSLCPKSS